MNASFNCAISMQNHKLMQVLKTVSLIIQTGIKAQHLTKLSASEVLFGPYWIALCSKKNMYIFSLAWFFSLLVSNRSFNCYRLMKDIIQNKGLLLLLVVMEQWKNLHEQCYVVNTSWNKRGFIVPCILIQRHIIVIQVKMVFFVYRAKHKLVPSPANI